MAKNDLKPLPELSKTQLDLFWSRIQRGTEVECWPWTAYKLTPEEPYGIMVANQVHFRAHRMAWAIANGRDPAPLHVLHKCDNPPCCNPSHLFAGTRGDNNRDCRAKGRGGAARGEASGRAKMTEEKVRDLRNLHTPKHGLLALARKFSIGKSTALAIINRRTWKHVR